MQMISDVEKEVGSKLNPENRAELLDEFDVFLGDVIAVEWQLPLQVRNSINYHRDYQQCETFHEEAPMTYLSHQLADWLVEPDSSVEEILEDSVLERLNFYPEDVQTLIDKRDRLLGLLSAVSS